MLCQTCGKSAAEDARFCRFCGAALDRSIAVAQSASTPAGPTYASGATSAPPSPPGPMPVPGRRSRGPLIAAGVAVLCLFACVILTVVAGLGSGTGPLPPEDALARTRASLETIETMHFVLDGTMRIQGEDVEIAGSGDMALPDEFRMDGRMTLDGQTIEFEEVLVDGSLYVRMPDARTGWTEVAGGASLSQGGVGFDPDAFLACLEAGGPAGDLGATTIDGRAVHHYSVDVPASDIASMFSDGGGDASGAAARDMLASADIECEVWVGEDDHLPYRVWVRMSILEPEAAEIDVTIEYSDFNAPVTIVAPIDVTDPM